MRCISALAEAETGYVRDSMFSEGNTIADT